MIIVVCVDESNGVLFNKRRVSSDRIVTEKICELAQGGRIFMSPYSEKLFPSEMNITAREDYLAVAGSGDVCFVETDGSLAYAGVAEKLVVFKWNRRYPSDVQFPLEQYQKHMRLTAVCEFPGYSHDKITQEVYAL